MQLNVQVAVGQRSYSAGLANVDFKRLSSATMDVKLPASGLGLPLPKSSPEAGAVYRGLIVGVLGRNGVIKPLSVRWPDTQGASRSCCRISPGGRPSVSGRATSRRSPVVARPGGPADPARCRAPDAAYPERDRGRARLGLILGRRAPVSSACLTAPGGRSSPRSPARASLTCLRTTKPRTKGALMVKNRMRSIAAITAVTGLTATGIAGATLKDSPPVGHLPMAPPRRCHAEGSARRVRAAASPGRSRLAGGAQVRCQGRPAGDRDVGPTVVLVFKATGKGTTTVAFGLTRGETAKAYSHAASSSAFASAP